MLANPYNWLGLLRVPFVIVRPMRFFVAVLTRRTLPDVVVRTPVGQIRVHLCNFESLKTLFSVFCRRDYMTRGDRPFVFVDIGANIGIASAYFLTRHPENRVVCYEPDRGNLATLDKNLRLFADRAEVHPCAIAPSSGVAVLFRSEDGKYSSLVPSNTAYARDQVECRSFPGVLAEVRRLGLPIVVKLDVEGMEPELVKSISWQEHPNVHRVLCESTECSALISRRHVRCVRNGYVEDMTFVHTDLPASVGLPS